MAPGFFGLFSKRDNAKTLRKAGSPGSPRSPKSPAGIQTSSTAKGNTSPSIADNSENLEGSQLSLDTDYVLADVDSPPVPSTLAYPLAPSSSTSGASASSTKLKMPFRRKQSTSSKFSTTTTQYSVPPVPPTKEQKVSIESSISDSPSLRPPPSRSAIFGSYADPHNALSTHSLPQDAPFPLLRRDSADTARIYETMSNPDSHMPSHSPLHPPKPSSKGGLFAWARPRGRTKSKPAAPTPDTVLPSRSSSALASSATDSFNLKSFRHVTSPLSTSPNPDPSSRDSLDPPARPRPRGDSIASDSSQRISVAAFREVQARRSAANSPVPSSPGDRDSCLASGQVRSRKRLSTLGTSPPLPNTGSEPRLSVSRSPPPRSYTAPLFLSASASSSESSEEGESDSDEEEATLRPNRKRTVTSRSAGGTQSELGHRTSLGAAFSSARSDVGHGGYSRSPSRPALAQPSKNIEPPARTSRNSSVYSHNRASVSASALVPDAAAKRISIISKHSKHSAASKLTQPLRPQSRASTSSEEESSSSSSSLSSEDAPLSSLLPPPRPGSATSRASSSPVRRPTKPLIDIGELVGGNTAPPVRTPEQSRDSQVVSKEDPPSMRPRKTSFGIGERLSALANGISGSQPSRPMSPESASDSKDEAFIPPPLLDKPPQSPAHSSRASPPPRSQTKSASPALKPKGTRSQPGMRIKSPSGFRIDTAPLKSDPSSQPPSSTSASSDAPIPHITPTPIRERHDPPAFAVTSRPISHASNPSVGTLAALDSAIAETNNKQSQRPAASGMVDKTRNDQQRQSQQQQQQQGPQATVRVVRSGPSKPPREESLPVPRPQQRSRVVSAGVTVSNIRVTPPPSSASSSPSMGRYGASGGPPMPLRKPFAIRDSSPASSAGESSSSRMPPTPRDGSELGAGPSGRPGPGHRKRVSVTFMDEVENMRDTRSSAGGRPSHGPAVVADSSDEEATLRGRERKAEEKRKERRRSEAKAAIELGKVINGTGPIEDDDDDDEDEDEDDGRRPMNVPPRMSMAMGMGMNRNVPFPSAVPQMGLQGQWNPSAGAQQPFANPLGSLSMQNLLSAGAGAGVGMGGGMNMPGGMNMNMNMGGGVGMGPGVGMVDPRMFVAHQQAMMIAKQTYQLAVAQQAMREAGDEWERGSTVSGWGGGGGGGSRSSMAAPSVLGMGMNMGMNMNPNAFGMPPGAWPSGGGGGGGSAARSMYAGSMYAASEVGGGGGGGMGWSTNSVYGESFGSPRDRSSRGFRQSQGQQQQHAQGGGGSSGGQKREGARQRTRTAPSSGAGQQARASAAAAAAAAGGVKRRPDAPGLVGVVSPPSSWKVRS